MATGTNILSLSPEILQQILVKLDPVDVSQVSQTCKFMHELVDPSTNHTLYRSLFLALFDPLQLCHRIGYQPTMDIYSNDSSEDNDIDYERLVKDRCRARGIVRSPHSLPKRESRAKVLAILEHVLLTASATHGTDSKNVAFLNSLLSSKSAISEWLLPQPHKRASDVKDSQATISSARRLHLSGLSRREVGWTDYRAGLQARETIYNCENFQANNGYGPFLVNEHENQPLLPDWTILDKVSQVMALNVKSAWHQWGDMEEMAMLPYGYDKAVFWKMPGPGRDWAAVEGVWHYIYAFIDFQDFFSFNFAPPPPPSQPRTRSRRRRLAATSDGGPSGDGLHEDLGDAVDEDESDVPRRPSLEGVTEAVGGVNTMRLTLMEPDEEELERNEGIAYPPLRFTGENLGPNGSRLRGFVKLLDDGSRFWSFIVRYDGEDRWVTNCVEVGARGAYGIWTDYTHEELSPCGPVWYFRA